MSDVRPSSPVYLYGLFEPGPFGALRYIGQAVNLRRRYLAHLREARAPRFHVHCWIKGLLDRGLKPEIAVLEESTQDRWREDEVFLIQYFRFLGCDLANLIPGGIGHSWMPEESLARMGEKHARDYLAIAPDGTRSRIRNLKKFCEAKGLPVNQSSLVCRGARQHARGWRFAYWGEEPPPLDKLHRFTPWVVGHPDGMVTITMSLKEMYREFGVHCNTLRLSASRNGVPSRNGWTCRRAIWKDGVWS